MCFQYNYLGIMLPVRYVMRRLFSFNTLCQSHLCSYNHELLLLNCLYNHSLSLHNRIHLYTSVHHPSDKFVSVPVSESSRADRWINNKHRPCNDHQSLRQDTSNAEGQIVVDHGLEPHNADEQIAIDYHLRNPSEGQNFMALPDSKSEARKMGEDSVSSSVWNSNTASLIDASDEATLSNILKAFSVYEQFVTVDEEKSIVDEVEPHLKRLKYESSHWDDVSKFYSI